MESLKLTDIEENRKIITDFINRIDKLIEKVENLQ